MCGCILQSLILEMINHEMIETKQKVNFNSLRTSPKKTERKSVVKGLIKKGVFQCKMLVLFSFLLL